MTATEASSRTDRTDGTDRTLRIGGRAYPVVLPTVRDPRLWLAGVIITLHVLGQTRFGFELSIAQILVAILTAALLELVITFTTRRIVAWPTSAMLTGNGVAFILRVPGTRHGDWWSLHGAWIFAATAAVSLLSKYVIHRRGRHLFNPSNFGLLLCFLVLGSTRATPLDFWWANVGPALIAALVVIGVGGIAITRKTAMFGAAATFWLVFAAALGVVAAAGHCMTARWHVGPVCGWDFWWVIVTSPEILVFLFFMITDPRTAPEGRRARVLYGGLVALVAAVLVAPQQSEFGTKVAVLGTLALVCPLRPLLERAGRAAWHASPRVALSGGLAAALVAAALVAAGRTPRPSAFTDPATAAAVTARPVVPIPAHALPVVHITSTGAFANALTVGDAQQAGRDLVADLVITADALRSRDPALAATAGDRLWLAHVGEQIAKANRTGRVTLTAYRFDRMTIAVLKLRATQAQPEIDLTVSGTATRVTSDGRRTVATTRSAFRRIFVVESVGGHYLLVDDRARVSTPRPPRQRSRA